MGPGWLVPGTTGTTGTRAKGEPWQNEAKQTKQASAYSGLVPEAEEQGGGPGGANTQVEAQPRPRGKKDT